jgi:DNA-binding CsgD family transcriptional regulator
MRQRRRAGHDHPEHHQQGGDGEPAPDERRHGGVVQLVPDRNGRALAGDQVVGRLLSRGNAPDELSELSEREREVLGLMAEGPTNTGIAKRLYLSERTVEAHVRHVLLKLDIPDTEDGHRRVLAVLAHVSATKLPPSAPASS